jgi:tRNA-modifying protein YgfZ
MSSPVNPLEGTFFDLSTRTKIHVRGQDRDRYLNGQITNDLSKANESTAIAACVLNAKGKMDAFAFVSRDVYGYIIDSDAELRFSLPSRLERYVIADDVQIVDVTQQLSIFHIIGAAIPDLEDPCRVVSANRFGVDGTDLWIESSQHDKIFEQLAASVAFCDYETAEVFRIERGIPRWGRELTNEILPPEVNLEAQAIDYDKGCYIGQEVISRMKMSGQRSKKLVGLVSVEGAPLEAGMKLFPIGADPKEVGWITSSVRSKRLDREIALGFTKRPFFPAKFKLDARNVENPLQRQGARVEIVDLPFTGEAS